MERPSGVTAAIRFGEVHKEGDVSHYSRASIRGFEDRCRKNLISLILRPQRAEIAPLERDADDTQVVEREQLMLLRLAVPVEVSPNQEFVKPFVDLSQKAVSIAVIGIWALEIGPGSAKVARERDF